MDRVCRGIHFLLVTHAPGRGAADRG